MLAYAHINLLSMLSRFEPDEAVRVATDSISVMKTALSKQEGVGPTSLMRCTRKGIAISVSPATSRQPRGPPRDGISSAQGREKGESLFMPMEHAANLAKPK